MQVEVIRMLADQLDAARTSVYEVDNTPVSDALVSVIDVVYALLREQVGR